MNSFGPMFEALKSYIWLIFFALVLFIFQKPIIRLFRKMNNKSNKANSKSRITKNDHESK
jgi:flagellar biosynthesis/type III secretory pathway M-ring protein FliF/YscJ